MSAEQKTGNNSGEYGRIENDHDVLTPPERVSDLELGSLLASVGNHEAKALTLVAMSDGRTYTDSPLAKALRAMQGPYLTWPISRGTPITYCADDFADSGLVAQDHHRGTNYTSFGYVITEKGIDLGLPLAGLLLGFSLKYPDTSLVQLFGNTTSPRGGEVHDPTADRTHIIRSPFVRYQIMWHLLTSSKRSIRDIAQELGLDQTLVGSHVTLLDRNGLVKFHSSDKPTRYSLIDGGKPLPRKSSSGRSMAHAIMSVARDLPEMFSLEDAAARLSEMQGDSDDLIFYRSVRNALDRLVGRGYFAKTKLHPTDRTSITMSSDQEEMLYELVRVLDAFQGNEPIVMRQGYDVVSSLLKSPHDCGKLMGKARKFSYAISEYSPEDRKKILTRLLSESDRPQDINELHALLERETGELMLNETVRRYLNELVNVGRVARLGNRGKYRWSLSDQ